MHTSVMVAILKLRKSSNFRAMDTLEARKIFTEDLECLKPDSYLFTPLKNHENCFNIFGKKEDRKTVNDKAIRIDEIELENKDGEKYTTYKLTVYKLKLVLKNKIKVDSERESAEDYIAKDSCLACTNPLDLSINNLESDLFGILTPDCHHIIHADCIITYSKKRDGLICPVEGQIINFSNPISGVNDPGVIEYNTWLQVTKYDHEKTKRMSSYDFFNVLDLLPESEIENIKNNKPKLVLNMSEPNTPNMKSKSLFKGFSFKLTRTESVSEIESEMLKSPRHKLSNRIKKSKSVQLFPMNVKRNGVGGNGRKRTPSTILKDFLKKN